MGARQRHTLGRGLIGLGFLIPYIYMHRFDLAFRVVCFDRCISVRILTRVIHAPYLHSFPRGSIVST